MAWPWRRSTFGESQPSRRRTLTIVAGVIAGLLVLAAAGGGVWALRQHTVRRLASHGESVAPSSEGSAAASSSILSTAPSTSSLTSTPGAGVPVAAGGQGSKPGAPTVMPARAPFVAYRVGGEVWVAGENGKGSKRVVAGSSDAYALSPDGRTLASVELTGKTLRLVDVGSGWVVSVAGAVAEPPAWAPDSSWVAFTGRVATGLVVRRVSRYGTSAKTLAPGAGPQVSPDGAAIAFLTGGAGDLPGDRLSTLTLGGGAAAPLPDAVGVTGFAWASPGSLYYAVHESSGPSLWLEGLDGSRTSVRSAPSQGGAVSFTALVACPPDGASVMFAATGDDGYSRVYIGGPGSGGATPVPTRRDAYPYEWTADRKGVLFFEGNVMQGEPSRLLSAHDDGTGRLALIEGAAR